jgi:hypothetical protein
VRVHAGDARVHVLLIPTHLGSIARVDAIHRLRRSSRRTMTALP